MMNTQLAVKKTTGFDLQPKDMSEAMRLATMIANSQLAPKDFKGKPEDTMVAMMMGNELGLNPMQAIQNIAVINGRPSIWGDALLALVQNHPSYGGVTESFDDATMTATCVAWRKGGEKHTQTFSQADAATAGLWGSNRQPWKQYPKRMLAMRARGFALRNVFADALLGLITAEEAQDMPEEVRQPTVDVEVVSNLISDEQATALIALAEDVNANLDKFYQYFQIGAMEGLPISKHEQAIAMLEAKRK